MVARLAPPAVRWLIAVGATFALGLSGCLAEAPTRAPAAASPPEPVTPDPAAPGPSEPVTPEPEAPRLVVHEWGTYTSVMGSDGAILEGLHHEEERLPPFVHRRALTPQGMKGLETLPEGVTQKLETPVIYFYGAEGQAVTVDVGFPEGLVSEWYPAASSLEPAIGALTGIRGGHARWEVTLDGTLTDAALPPVGADDLWAPSRKVAALGLRATTAEGSEPERFIFYRGLGRFDMPFRVTSQPGSPTLTLTNESDEAIAAVFLLRVTGAGGAIQPLGALPAHGTRVAAPTPKEHPLDLYSAEARAVVIEALEASGLYADESAAMVDTWFHSYFRTPGLRVLYVAPQAWADTLLPLTVTPAPDEVVRTLVGRVEVLTADEEEALVAAVKAAGPASAPVSGRFAEPKLRRVRAILAARGEAAAASWCDGQIQALNVP